MISRYDVIIVGAGGAGMMCAIEAGKRGRSVLVLDHAQKIGGKILISGGGRCNFTNMGASPAQYVSSNPHFCKSAFARFTPAMFIDLVKKHGIPFHEKKLGQLFCDQSAQAIVELLSNECHASGASLRLGCKIQGITKVEEEGVRFHIETNQGFFKCDSLVIATGGLSIPKLGATDFGYRIARQFGLKVVETAPALDGFTFSTDEQVLFKELAGVSVDCVMSANDKLFRENILFTHTGLSGPAALQVSLHWKIGDSVLIDLLPDLEVFQWLMEKKKAGNRSLLKNLLAEILPARFASRFCELYLPAKFAELPLPQIPEKELEAFSKKLHAWTLLPAGTVGYSKAEVTRGGVDTEALSSKTMEARQVPGLYFIGEVVDVTGWLGGYNFQWAWASGWAAGQDV